MSLPFFKRRRRRNRRKKAARRPIGRWLVAAMLVAAAGVAALKWAESPQGRMSLANKGVTSAASWAQRSLGDRILEALLDAGVSPDSISVSTPDARHIVTMRATSQQHLTRLNAAVSGAVEAAGGSVHRGTRHAGEEGSTVELEVGTSGATTHRVLLQHGVELVELPPLPAGRLAIVIDDWGHNLSLPARRILALDMPLTLAILPELSFSRRVLTEAKRAKKRTLLHLPMQPGPEVELSAGKDVIEVGMPAAEIEVLTERFLDGLVGVAGVNNHMGSLATQHRAEMAAVMAPLAKRGLIFLDSFTTPRSVAGKVAAEFGVPTAQNDLFVDADTEDPAVVEKRLWQLVERARRRGHAVGIGHVNHATAQALEQLLQRLDPTDVQLVFLDELIHGLPQ